MVLKIGSNGPNVKILQRFLGLKDDGSFGPVTQKAVKTWQKKNGLLDDGIVGPLTWSKMKLDQLVTTDVHENQNFFEEGNLSYKEYFLPADQYLTGPTKKEFLFLHHTAGGHNPYACVDMWAKDDRGRIATEFVLGGPACNGKDDRYDGCLVQCIPTGGYGWHLGENGSQHMHEHSVGIEVCNFGYVTKGGFFRNRTWIAGDPAKFYNYGGGTVADSHVTTLAKPFRNYKTWHKYSDNQLTVLKEFILFIANRDNIDVRKGLIEEIRKNGADGFEWNENAYYGRTKGMWTHTNTRKDKVDLYPQQELMDMLLSI